MPTPHAASPEEIVRASTKISTRAPGVRSGRAVSAEDTICRTVRRRRYHFWRGRGQTRRTRPRPTSRTLRPNIKTTPTAAANMDARASSSRGRNRRRTCGFPRGRKQISRKITRRDRPASKAERCNKYNAASRKMAILDDGGKGLVRRLCYSRSCRSGTSSPDQSVQKAAGPRIVRVQSKCGAEFADRNLRCAHPRRGPCQGWNAPRPAGDCR